MSDLRLESNLLYGLVIQIKIQGEHFSYPIEKYFGLHSKKKVEDLWIKFQPVFIVFKAQKKNPLRDGILRFLEFDFRTIPTG